MTLYIVLFIHLIGGYLETLNLILSTREINPFTTILENDFFYVLIYILNSLHLNLMILVSLDWFAFSLSPYSSLSPIFSFLCLRVFKTVFSRQTECTKTKKYFLMASIVFVKRMRNLKTEYVYYIKYATVWMRGDLNMRGDFNISSMMGKAFIFTWKYFYFYHLLHKNACQIHIYFQKALKKIENVRLLKLITWNNK